MSKNRAPLYDVPKHHHTLWEEQKTKAFKPTAEKGDAKAAGFSEAFVPELFHRLYATTPNKVEKPESGAQVRGRIHELVAELPEFETLRKQTVRDPMWAGMATSALSASVAEAMPAMDVVPDEEEANKVLEGLQALLQQNPEQAEALQAYIDAARKAKQEAVDGIADQAAGVNETDIRNAARRGIGSASQSIADAEQACTALGYGNGPGNGGVRNPQVALQLARKVAASPSLKAIIEIAGRLTAIARSKRMSRTDYARSEVVGVEPTDKLARIIPSEMVNLSSPLGTAILLRKLFERNALGYSMKGQEKVGKGPIILCIDQSGSMIGDQDTWAKGIALALLDSARAEKRAFGIILYDDGVRRKELYPDPEKVNPVDILDILSSFSGGGTEFSRPLTQALDWIAQAPKFSKADIIHITDGDACGDASIILDRAKKMGCAIYGIAIGGGVRLQDWSTEPIAQISDVHKDTAAVNTIFDNV